jgi:hypothetical protein
MHSKKPLQQIHFNYTSRHEIEKVIKSSKFSNSYRYDEISIKIIKESSPFMSSPLNKIRNQALSSGIFPEYLKYSDIKPIYKNGAKYVMTNSRPISLLPSFSKIFDKLIFMRLLQHFTNNYISSKEKFGFKSHSSTDKAIFKLLNEILNALNNKLTIRGLFCNLEKAFVCVDHNILLSKLRYYGITGSMYLLIQSYLTGRYQCILESQIRTYIRNGVQIIKEFLMVPSLDPCFL